MREGKGEREGSFSGKVQLNEVRGLQGCGEGSAEKEQGSGDRTEVQVRWLYVTGGENMEESNDEAYVEDST